MEKDLEGKVGGREEAKQDRDAGKKGQLPKSKC